MRAHQAEAMTIIRQRPGLAREIARQLSHSHVDTQKTLPVFSQLGLTSKQAELLTYIRDFINDNGISPSFDEMRDYLGLQSKSGISRIVCALEERGHIFRLPNRARCIMIAEVQQ